MSLITWTAILVTVSGVFWVIAEQQRGVGIQPGKEMTGIITAFAGSCGQAVGLVLTKAGMAGVVDPLPATMLRLVAATAGVYLIMLFSGRTMHVLRAVRNLKAVLFVSGGALMGPVAGVWLSIIGVRYAEAGVAATLMGTVPVLVLPVTWLLYKERLSARSIFGTLVVVSGIALLFNR